MRAYLWDQIRRHARCFFTPDACRAMESEAVLFASYRQALEIRRPVIVIPDDIPAPIIPAWNLHGNLIDLLSFREERGSQPRDRYGRFISAFSPRLKDDLLNVPAFNEAVALLVGAAVGLKQNGPRRCGLTDTSSRRWWFCRTTVIFCAAMTSGLNPSGPTAPSNRS